MPSFPIGDMSQFFQNVSQTTAIKSRMQTLAKELSTGQVQDLSRTLGGDTRRLASVDREITLLDGFAAASADLDRTLTQQSILLDGANNLRVTLGAQFLAVATGSTPAAIAESGVAARSGFSQVVGSMNATIGGRSLFAGTADDTVALAPAEDMLADIVAAIGGATTSAAITAVLDTWFDDPAGGFATMAYQGDTGDLVERKISATEAVTQTARADDPAIRDLLKSLAKAAVVDLIGPGLTQETQKELVLQSGESLNVNSVALVNLAASVGAAQARVEEVAIRQAAQRGAFAMTRNDLVSADPYETAVKLQEIQTQLELQFTMTSRLQGLSLVNYI